MFLIYHLYEGDKHVANLVNSDTKNEPEPVAVVQQPQPKLPEVPQETTAETNPEVIELINKAMAYINEKPSRIIDARDILNEALLKPMSFQQQMSIKEKLSEFADRWLFSSEVFPKDTLCDNYRVKRGDKLILIGKQFKMTAEVLQQVNNIATPQSLRAEDTIKIIKGPFNARVYCSTFTMDLYLQNTFVKSFHIGVGKLGKQTPTGLWRVKADGKVPFAVWTNPDTGEMVNYEDPNYPLGSRWIKLEGIEGKAKDQRSYGIHGTNENETIGEAASRGCIRLNNDDVIQVYDLLVPVHSLIRVMD
jgi:LysM repeat protein